MVGALLTMREGRYLPQAGLGRLPVFTGRSGQKIDTAAYPPMIAPRASPLH